ncbi:MAG: hypothetical protein K2K40_08830 [Paramuribaculum sp.]|nr:hypothetical protein [Paramuribaculum sp.]
MILTGLVMTSCQDDIDLNISPEIDEGKPASITLNITMPDMSVKSRSMIDDNAASEINSLWLGIYTSEGERLFSKLYDFSSTGYHDEKNNWKEIELDEKEGVTSGKRRIVAVANVTRNFGITDNEDMKKELNLTQRVVMSQLLEKADTWEKYKSISTTVTDISSESQEPAVAGNLVMSGLYHNSTTEPTSWVDHDGFIDIQPGKNILSGGIHLRRVVSYIRFNIKADPKSPFENFVVTPTSWSVKNVPVITYLYETTTNAADKPSILINDKLQRNYKNYTLSNTFDRSVDENNDNIYSFDFYQLDNKHTGNANNYNEREDERKDDNGLNTGYYTALDDNGQNATYVEFTADISYSYINEDNIKINRVAKARYVVHLGYIDHDPKDFNVLRNSIYTYNVIIKDVNKIILEANKEDVTNGVEGEVYDTYQHTIELDSHYCTFNIKLTNAERKALSYNITAPYGNEEIRIDNNSSSDLRSDNNRFFNWILFKPAPDQKDDQILAVYKTSPEDNNQWTLNQLADIENNSGDYNNYGDIDDPTEYLYTVFVNEYVYPSEENISQDDPEWWKYIDIGNRVIWLHFDKSLTSTDNESLYGRAKYMISQKSIQTYYSTEEGSRANTIFGIEHINESYGLNIRFTATAPIGGWNPDNGRWNMWQYVQNLKWADVAEIGSGTNKERTVKMANSPAITQGKNPEKRSAASYPVFQLTSKTGTGTNYDPNNSNSVYEVLSACMSRNRDLNGDGNIDANELRWYLPALGKYVRIVLGRHSLENPLFDPTKTDLSQFVYGQDNNSFHYASSDNKVLWAEEGFSIGNSSVNANQWNYAWQIRCIRNLGNVNLNRVLEEDPVQMAYERDETQRIITMRYYDRANYRSPENRSLPAHVITSDYNQPTYQFEYAADDCTGINDETTGMSIGSNDYALNNFSRESWLTSVNANSICSKYTQNGETTANYPSNRGPWRVPNQKELTILRRYENELFSYYNGYVTQWPSSSIGVLPGDTRFSYATYNNLNGAQYWTNTMAAYEPERDRRIRVRCVRDVIDNTRGN